jgi:hypothetical protein
MFSIEIASTRDGLRNTSVLPDIFPVSISAK